MLRRLHTHGLSIGPVGATSKMVALGANHTPLARSGRAIQREVYGKEEVIEFMDFVRLNVPLQKRAEADITFRMQKPYLLWVGFRP